MEIHIKGNRLKHGKEEIVLPKYVNINLKINELLKTKRELSIDYFNNYNSILNGEEVDQSKFDSIVSKINALEDEIEDLIGKRKRIGEDQKAVNNIHDQLHALKQSDIDALQKSSFDNEVGRTIAKNFKKRLALYNDLNGIKYREFTDFVKGTGYASSKKTPEKKIKPKPKTKTQLSPKEVVEIKDNIKELLKKVYKFKDKGECVSKQRSKEFYTSKEDILKEVEKNDNLKKLMPANYKNLSKEKLCEYFFDK